MTILSLLPGVVSRFKVNPAQSMPTWLNNVLIQGLGSSNSDVVNATINQIGYLRAVSLADNLVAKYGSAQNSTMRIQIIRALGDMASNIGVALLKSIIDTYALCPETDEAIISARKMCATALVSDISAYASNLDARITRGEFVSSKTMSLAAPDESLMIAKGSLQAIVNGSCAQ